MTKFYRFALVLALPLGAFAANSSLLQMVMPDAQVVAGLQVDSAKSSAFGQYVLSQISVNDTKLEQFTSETGFDPRQDVSEIVIASNWKPNTPDNHWIVAASGTFNIATITAAVQANGGVIATYQGISVVTLPAGAKSQVATAIAFLDSSTALAGDINSVKGAIDQKKSNTPANPSVVSQAQTASTGKDFWFVTLVPLSNFSSSIPVFNNNGAANGNFLAAINQASGGISFGDTVMISAQAVTRSEKDAQALVDVVKFFASLIQLNRQNNPAAGQVATLLDTLQASASGNITSISLAIPEQQLEQLINSTHASPAKASKAALRVN
jgi:putative lipoic acid-binding regulatory protein